MQNAEKQRRNHRQKRARTAVVALLLLPVALLATEGILHVAGYGSPTRFFIPVADQEAFTGNPRFTWQFFPRGLGQEPILFRAPRHKPASTKRIFVFGASAAAGVPDVAFSFSRILDVMLERAYPNLDFEIINTATVAINSHVVRQIAEEALALEPDLFIVYLGHTEMIGPYGAATALDTRQRSRLAIATAMAARRSRTGQWLDAVTERLAGRGEWQQWRGMEMFMATAIHPNDRRLKRGYANFTHNLETIGAAARKANVPIVFCTVPSNLRDCPPFASLHPKRMSKADRTTFQATLDLGAALEQGEQFEQALVAYSEALTLDAHYAELHYRMARCHEALGNIEDAYHYFVAARDSDALRFRADSNLNETIRRVAEETDAALADIEKYLKVKSVTGVPGHDFFFEHAHLHYEGNLEIAKYLYTFVVKQLAGQGLATDRNPPDPASCSRLLAMTGWNRYRMADEILKIVEQPPFTAQLDHAEQMITRRRVARRLSAHSAPQRLQEALKLYRAASNLRPNDLLMRVNDARLAIRANDAKRAIEQWAWLLRRLPENPNLQYNMGTTLARVGELDEALEHLTQARELNPYEPRTFNNLGNILYARSNTDEAVDMFERALHLDPQFAEAHNNLGAILAAQKEHEEAITHYRAAIAANPSYAEAHNNLGSVLYVSGDRDGAIAAYEEATLLQPTYLDARLNLGRTYFREKDYAAALPQFMLATQQAPSDPLILYELGATYAGLHRLHDAKASFAQALLLKPDWPEAKEALTRITALERGIDKGSRIKGGDEEQHSVEAGKANRGTTNQ